MGSRLSYALSDTAVFQKVLICCICPWKSLYLQRDNKKFFERLKPIGTIPVWLLLFLLKKVYNENKRFIRRKLSN